MFSLDRFYHILHNNLISNFPNSISHHFHPFGTYDSAWTLVDQKNFEHRILEGNDLSFVIKTSLFECFYYDQEPLFETTPLSYCIDSDLAYKQRDVLFANSEKSEIKNKILRDNGFYDWYYFFHGFAALDWYRDYQYFDESLFEHFDKVFICYNHLISKYRSYRLHLVSNIIENGLDEKGHVSFFLEDKYGDWKSSILDKNCPLSTASKVKIFNTLKNVTEPLTIDTSDPCGALSAQVTTDWCSKALWHVVTETIYFEPKLHLTEKIFKPIVAKRPFLLVGAVGNLAYLKSYGFKTFDKWIDESYDLEPDNTKRIEMITHELTKLCSLDKSELRQMHREMKEILDFNHKHFFGDFKKIIVNELVDNFCVALSQMNHGRIEDNHSMHNLRYELSPEKVIEIKARLLS